MSTSKGLFLRYGCAVVAMTAFGFASAQSVHAATASVYVLAPMPYASLQTVEKQGAQTPVFTKDFSISYSTIEPLIRDDIKKAVDGSKEGSATCPSDFCPDIHWRATFKTGFAFTDNNQPEIEAFGDPQQPGAMITLDTKVKLELDVTVKVWIEVLGKEKDAITKDYPGEYDYDVVAGSTLNLWPSLHSTFDFTPALENSTAIYGVTVDYFDHDTAVDATNQISAEIEKRRNELVAKFEQEVGAEARKAVDAGIPNAVSLKDKFLNTKLPLVGKSFQDLSSAFGLTFDVRTNASKYSVNVVATVRFAGAPGDAKLIGKVRLPKERCTYVGGVHGLLVVKIPTELEKINTSLAGKVGSSCSSIFPASSIKFSRYHGADPNAAFGGTAQSQLPTWEAAGGLSFVGKLIDHQTVTGSGAFKTTGYYQCGFEISNVPDADIIELLASSPLVDLLGDYADQPRLRYLEVSNPGPQIVFDANWNLLTHTPARGAQGLVIGGEGECNAQIVKLLQVLEEGLPSGCPVCGLNKFIHECPQCGIRKVREGLFEITSPLALLRNPKFKGVVDLLKEDESFRLAPTVQQVGPPASTQQFAPK